MGAKESFIHSVGIDTDYQCSILCESSYIAHGSSKQRWVPQTTCDTLKEVQATK